MIQCISAPMQQSLVLINTWCHCSAHRVTSSFNSKFLELSVQGEKERELHFCSAWPLKERKKVEVEGGI